MSRTHPLQVLSSRSAAARTQSPLSAPRASEAPGSSPRLLRDSHNRTIRDLRLSITDRCNFRCVYCMEPDVRFFPREQLLSVDELVRLATISKSLGIQRLRLTGGEPTLRPELDEIIERIGELGFGDLSMTTNGSLIEPARLRLWKAAGLKRLTFSLDSANETAFASMTRSRSTPSTVLQAIEEAHAAGLGPIKVNAVVIRDHNVDQIPLLAELAASHNFEMRFIEFMPLDSGHAWNAQLLVPASEILAALQSAGDVTELCRERASDTAEIYSFASRRSPGSVGKVGIIAPVSRSFCGNCSRLRITADGKVRPCLFSLREFDVRPLLRSNAEDATIEQFMIDATWTKQAGHGISSPDFEQPARPMSAIGG
ncbi:MAG: GTP 3',8-cyclase MoaA [Phycisphaeraceae bacterium]|nr:GTP 3',8-cyclase MoaA [Phycisphaeraceae bacterium]